MRPPSGLDSQPSFPIRAAFYYPSFPEAWTRNGIHPYTRHHPSLGLYDSGSSAVIERHLSDLEWGGVEVGISSWEGAGTPTDTRLASLLSQTSAAGSPVKWAVYHEQEEEGAPSVAEIVDDLARIRSGHGAHSAYFRVGGRPVVFVAGGADDGCATARRWKEANATNRVYLVLEAFPGFRLCPSQPDGWHRYTPSQPASSQPEYWYSISPGYWRPDEASPQLERRTVAEWEQAIRDMIASDAPFQLVTTFNWWGDGSAVEPADEWTGAACTAVCHGTYLNALHRDGQAAQPPPPPPPPPPGDPVIGAAGDIACDSASSGFNGGFGTESDCRQLYTSDLLVGRGLAAVLPLGDLQYDDGVLTDFQRSYDASWGRLNSIVRPVPGNHDYHTTGAAGYFDYFNGAGNLAGIAGERGKGYYSYEIGAWHLVALNSNCDEVGGCDRGSPQEQWLRQDLESHPADCTLAYWHHPRFSSGSHESIEDTDGLWAALYESGAELVLSGHDHDYERFAPQNAGGLLDTEQGVRQFVVGTGGKGLRPFPGVEPNSRSRDASTFGVLMLTLHDDSYDWRFVPEAGGTFSDSGSASCHGDPPPATPTGLTAAPGDGKADLQWTANDEGELDHYVLRRATAPAGPFTEVAGQLRTTSHADTGLVNGTTYYYELVACDARSRCSSAATASATPRPPASAQAPQPTFPIRAAFYYPWFPEAWEQDDVYPFTDYAPSLGFYQSSARTVRDAHLRSLEHARFDAGIYSWWGQGTNEDRRFQGMLDATNASATPIKWTLYHELEGNGPDPTVSEIGADLDHIKSRYTSDPAYLKAGGRPVIFVYGDAGDDCTMADRWKQANSASRNFYVVLKIVPGHETCASQPDAWHQYAPAKRSDHQPGQSYSISPGFDLTGPEPERLPRDLSAFAQAAGEMVGSGEPWQLVTTFNEWGENTATESAQQWSSPSGHGRYLDVLAGLP